MTRFAYRAAREDGERLRGVIHAPTDTAAVALLVDRGLMPLAIDAADERPRRQPPDELARLFAGVAALLHAGLTVDRVLAAGAQGATGASRDLLEHATQRVREGASLSAAFDASGGVPQYVIGMLRAGEAQGRLAEAASRAASELERQAETRARLRAALTYPAFLMAAGTASVTLIVGYVIPRFASLLGDLGQTLPRSTRMLLAISVGVREHGLVLVTAIGATLIIGAYLWQRPEIRAHLHRGALGWPVIGPLRARLAGARVCRTLSALLDSGIPLLTALDLTRSGCDDLSVAARLAAARDDVSQGSRLEPALRRHAALTGSALQLVHFGEETGRLGEFLGHAARNEDSIAQRTLRDLVTTLEPLLILCFGAIVAFVAAALLQAVYSVRPAGF